MFIPERYKSKVDVAFDVAIPGKGVLRSMMKTCTWRVLATTDTFLLGYLLMPWILGIEPDAAFAGGIALFEVISKMFLYFIHERAWARVGAHRYPPKKRRVRINCRKCGTTSSKTITEAEKI